MYIRSLAPFDSKFDKSITNQTELSQKEIKWLQSFYEKAACATCHFPPAFNGTVPPKYVETEFEHLGTPQNNDFDHPVLDGDLGAYLPYQVSERKGL